jgi:hypothetical protein
VECKKSRLAAALSFWKLGRGQIAITADRSLPLRRIAVKPRAGKPSVIIVLTIQSGGELGERKGKDAKGNESNFAFTRLSQGLLDDIAKPAGRR